MGIVANGARGLKAELQSMTQKYNKEHDANLRSVSALGVRTVMDCFLRHHPPSQAVGFEPPTGAASTEFSTQTSIEQALVCEEELLNRPTDG